MKRKILIGLNRYDFDPSNNHVAENYLLEHGFELSFFEKEGDHMRKAEMIERIGDADACIHYGYLDRDVLAAAKKLKIMTIMAVGFDTTDVAACKEHNVRVTIARCPEHAQGVAEVAMTLMLVSNYDVIKRHHETTAGHFHQYVGEQMYGKTLGIVGFGWIGQRLARLVMPYGMRVLAYDPYPNPQAAFALDAEYVSLDELLKESDFVSVHIPGTPENYHLFNDATFAKMKQGAQFINTSRGVNVDEDALYRALTSGHLKGAALDVMENEGEGKMHPLYQLENFCVLPHTGGHNLRARNAMIMRCAKNIVEFFEGKEPPYQLWK